jgi:hypothetical protein
MARRASLAFSSLALLGLLTAGCDPNAPTMQTGVVESKSFTGSKSQMQYYLKIVKPDGTRFTVYLPFNAWLNCSPTEKYPACKYPPKAQVRG